MCSKTIPDGVIIGSSSGGYVYGRLCVGDRAGSARFVLFFPRKPICRTDVGGDGSGGCFSAAAGQLHHSITL